MTTYKITHDQDGWHVLQLADDGVWNALETVETRERAKQVLAEIKADNSEGNDRAYQAGYAYAAGYPD